MGWFDGLDVGDIKEFMSDCFYFPMNYTVRSKAEGEQQRV